MFNTEDDDDFSPAASSKLASLFGQSSDPGNTSLTYIAPKQPKKGQTGKTSTTPSHHSVQTSKLNIIIVKVVQSFRLEAGNYNAQGKLGAAVLGCPKSRIFQLLLYKNKQQHITTTKITENFKLTVQANNYASFYDDQRQNWSILFDSEQDVIEFAKQVGVACASSYRDQEPQPFYIQELKVGDGVGAELGDHLEVRFTISPLLNCSIDEVLENNLNAEKPQRVKIRKGVWEEALLGICKGGKRLIILAPVLFGPWKPQAPENSRLVIEVEVVRIKSAKKSREPTPTRLKHLAESSESNVDSSTDETSIKARGASISEALTNSPKTHKASIISRMARMGQPTLPLKGAIVCNPSDSEETEEEGVGFSGGSSSAPSKPVAKTRTTMLKARSSRQSATQDPPAVTATPVPVSSATSTPAAQQLSVFPQPVMPWQQAQPPPHLLNGIPFAMTPQYNHITQTDGSLYPAVTQQQLFPSAATVGTPPDSHLAVFMSENRAQNTELRMGINKVVDKVDQVIVKVDSLQQQRTLGQGPMGTMEPTVLLASVQKLVNEHGLLQTELAEKRSKLEQQNEKMYHLLNTNQKLMEQSSSMMERQDSALQTAVFTLQQEKEKLTAEIRDAEVKTHKFQEEASGCRRSESELKEEVKSITAELHRHQEELKNYQLSVLELEKKLMKSEEELKASRQIQQLQESSIADLKSSQAELQAAKVLVEESLSRAQQRLSQKNNEANEELAVQKEELKKLEARLRSQPPADGISVNQSVNHLEKKLQEMTEKYTTIVDGFEKEKAMLHGKIEKLQDQLKACDVSNPASTSDVVDGVKKIMNVLFRLLTSKFVPETSYDGAKIREILLTTIKDVTLQYLHFKTASESQPPQENAEPLGQKVLKAEGNKDVSIDKSLAQKQPSTEESKDKLPNNSSLQMQDEGNLSKPPNISVEQKQTPDEETKDKLPGSINEQQSTSNLEIHKTHDVKSPEPQTNLLATPVSESEIRQTRDSSLERGWRPQPPPSPLFDEEDDDDDWLS